MLLTASELSVNVAILDNEDAAIANMRATLHQLQEDLAILFVPQQNACTCLHWGSRVRFWMADGLQGYEVTGIVVAHEQVTEEAGQKVVLRLWECQSRQQRRALPRRNMRFPVILLRPEAEPQEQCLGTNVSSDLKPPLKESWCIDIGAGGMRLRTAYQETWPKRLELQFRLPELRDGLGCEQTANRSYRLTGQILRVTPARRHKGSVEIAVKFDLMTIEDGLSLTAFLNNAGN